MLYFQIAGEICISKAKGIADFKEDMVNHVEYCCWSVMKTEKNMDGTLGLL